jgi:cytochrome c556
MKCRTVLITFLSAAAFAVGCNRDQNTEQRLESVKLETDKAAQDLRNYSYAQKDAFVKETRRELAALNQDLDDLSAKIDKSSDSVKADAKPKVQALRDRVDKLNMKLADVENATESNWDNVKAGFNQAMDGVKDSFQQARQWLADKIAP